MRSRCCGRSVCPSRPTAKGGSSNGEDVARREATATPEVQGAQLHALPPVRPPARGLPQVRPPPDLPPRAGAPGRDSRHDEVELVGEKQCCPIRSQTCSPASATPTRR